jgi:hypothetical protein
VPGSRTSRFAVRLPDDHDHSGSLSSRRPTEQLSGANSNPKPAEVRSANPLVRSAFRPMMILEVRWNLQESKVEFASTTDIGGVVQSFVLSSRRRSSGAASQVASVTEHATQSSVPSGPGVHQRLDPRPLTPPLAVTSRAIGGAGVPPCKWWDWRSLQFCADGSRCLWGKIPERAAIGWSSHNPSGCSAKIDN